MPPDLNLAGLPRPPDRPDPQECCGRGCCPCIFDYYEDALTRWQTIVRERGFDPAQVLEAMGQPRGG